MPKKYSPQEREYIKKRLKEEAAACMGQYGIRRTTVDEIVKRVNIPKGTFYLFYPSKELLLFEVIQEQHDRINDTLQKTLTSIPPEDLSAETITDMVFRFFKAAEEMPVLKLMDSEEAELLIRRLPPEVIDTHLKEDTDTMGKFFALLPIRKDLDPGVLSAAFHAVYFATLHKSEIGGEQYDEALRLLIRGIVNQMF